MKYFVNSISQWDMNVFLQIFGWNGQKIPDRLFRLISRSGDGYYYAILGLMLLFLEPENGRLFLLTGLTAFAIELPLYKLIKNRVKRIRPFEQMPDILFRITPPDRFSFPSGHTAAAFLMALLIGHFYPVFLIPAFCWAALVGISRVYLGVHYPTDVLAGMAIGMLSAGAGITIL